MFPVNGRVTMAIESAQTHVPAKIMTMIKTVMKQNQLMKTVSATLTKE